MSIKEIIRSKINSAIESATEDVDFEDYGIEDEIKDAFRNALR